MTEGKRRKEERKKGRREDVDCEMEQEKGVVASEPRMAVPRRYVKTRCNTTRFDSIPPMNVLAILAHKVEKSRLLTLVVAVSAKRERKEKVQERLRQETHWLVVGSQAASANGP